jgi:hypothetical protein
VKLTERNYFSKKANMEYMSVSQFKSFMKCPACAIAEIKGKYKREQTTSLLVGSYVDAYFEGTLDKFKRANQEVFKKDGTLKADYIQAEAIIKRLEKDKLFMKYMNGKKQVIMTGEICGVPFKIKSDVLHDDKIVDMKIVKDFENIRDDEDGWLPWYEFWKYDLQGAAYQEIVRQNVGKKLPFYLNAATKEKVTDLDIIHLPQKMLDFQLENIQNNIVRFDAMKKGIIEADRCGKCDYCKQTKKLTEPTEADELYIF